MINNTQFPKIASVLEIGTGKLVDLDLLSNHFQ